MSERERVDEGDRWKKKDEEAGIEGGGRVEYRNK